MQKIMKKKESFLHIVEQLEMHIIFGEGKQQMGLTEYDMSKRTSVCMIDRGDHLTHFYLNGKEIDLI